MASPNEKLAVSLAALQKLQQGGRRVFRSNELTRVHRERLLRLGFLRKVMKGWLISSSPSAGEGDSTPWFASFWEFCALYCSERFGNDWHLSPEQSILLHAENTVIPRQVIIYTPRGSNNTISLLFDTSLYDLKQKQMPPKGDLTVRDGLNLFTPEAALLRVPEAFYGRYPLEAQIVLSSIKDASALLARLLDGGHSAVAGRLAGALRRIGRGDAADQIIRSMKSASYDVRESDPFAKEQTFGAVQGLAAPIVSRLNAAWDTLREGVLEVFPDAPGLPTPRDRQAYLRFVDEIYQSDAYHSLSIEGYKVTPELIDRVRSGDWNPDTHDQDRDDRDALAARGYWQAFQLVKYDIAAIIEGANPGTLTRATHRDWYLELFAPCVTAGLVRASALAGYRSDPVYIQGARHVPPRAEAARDAMPAVFDLLERELEPSVRAVLGHWLFGYIHPYLDGNGRMARFLMNAMLASGGYPWTVIRVEDRDDYMAALESASIDMDIGPFARFIAERVEWSLDQAA